MVGVLGQRELRVERNAAPALKVTILLALAVLLSLGAYALPAGFQEVTVFSGLNDPIAVRFAPDGSVFVAEKAGKIIYFANTTTNTQVLTADFSGDVYSADDMGLLGLAVHPQYASGAGKDYVYALYTRANSAFPSGRLLKISVDPSSGVMTNSEIILEGWCQMSNSHSIGDLHFGADGSLYVSGGEGADHQNIDYGQITSTEYPGQNCSDPYDEAANIKEGGSLRSQDLQTSTDPTGLSGTILRIDPETGLAMPGNPYFGDADENKARIIAYGERNPYRFAIRPQTTELWVQNTGLYTWEEINRIMDPADAEVENFGWPCYEGNEPQVEFATKNLTICEALYADDTTTKPHIKFSYTDRQSSSGIAFYTGDKYPSEYEGALFVADIVALFSGTDPIRVIFPDENGLPDQNNIMSFSGATLGPVDLQLSPDGYIYVADLAFGRILRIEYNALTIFGTLNVTTIPPGASILIDGVLQENTAPAMFNLSEGQHTVTAKLSGRTDASASITILANQTLDLPLTLAVASTGMRFNAGGPTYVDSQNNTWNPDIPYVIGSSLTFENDSAVSGTVDDTLYQTERWTDSVDGFNYEFPVPDGLYTVTLHFAEMYDGNFFVGARIFDALVEEVLTADDLDIYSLVGANAALTQSIVTNVTDGSLSLKFTPVVESPKVSAIEIVPVPNSYTCAEVAQHNDPLTDCWLIVDYSVFNVTEASQWHPAAYHCGENISDNYHKNHGAVIRPQMMKYKIGETTDFCPSLPAGGNQSNGTNPVTELFVPEGSWNPLNLMSVVESTNRSLLFIDGSTHTPVARMHDVGDRPHTSVFTPGGTTMFIISRDGWLTKIDLATLQPVASERFGNDSRGTAITSDGSVVAVGNYDPNTVVLVDATSMQKLATFDLVVEQNGTNVTSRAGALLEDGNNIIVALKDVNSVWVIDAKNLEVTHKYFDIGLSQTQIHDGFVTPDGKYFIVASQGSNTVWVLDLDTMVPVGEVPTGLTPHTGRGAVWGNYTFIPSLGEGNITAIDMRTWQPAAYIKTGGPGFFIRSYDADPTYPYVWADTSLGPFKDEIYVIDGASLTIKQTLVPMPGNMSIQPEFTRNGKYVYISITEGNKVFVYDSLTFEVAAVLDATTPTAISNVASRLPLLMETTEPPVTPTRTNRRGGGGGSSYIPRAVVNNTTNVTATPPTVLQGTTDVKPTDIAEEQAVTEETTVQENEGGPTTPTITGAVTAAESENRGTDTKAMPYVTAAIIIATALTTLILSIRQARKRKE